MKWIDMQTHLQTHDVAIVVGPHRSGKTEFITQQYGDRQPSIDVYKASKAYSGGNPSITDEEWLEMTSRDCPFIAAIDVHTLKSEDLFQLIHLASETKKKLYLTCFDIEAIPFSQVMALICEKQLSLVKIEMLESGDVYAWSLVGNS
ncbi:hypothetical protein [Enterovibrio nigricans]|uniref:AAA domain-containing protein n=1 Tax=Enterovibrio nigricans DSM 22720 TaxID=1121868 RepID=A0A1T4VUE6_9GAMM|nr:hypothetical protein [Enterovibrio nigricans]PKF49410.1 hypothetical protein AT251_19065 [Enterovibrio nigricans]SKA68539.1 hypothetical protein SAMN02745132_04303 [Enterovibrio nigricans DSM 22720]